MAAAKKATLEVQLKSGHQYKFEVPADSKLPGPDEHGWVEFGNDGQKVAVHESNIVLSKLTKS